jgi:hypothetical protein
MLQQISVAPEQLYPLRIVPSIWLQASEAIQKYPAKLQVFVPLLEEDTIEGALALQTIT